MLKGLSEIVSLDLSSLITIIIYHKVHYFGLHIVLGLCFVACNNVAIRFDIPLCVIVKL